MYDLSMSIPNSSQGHHYLCKIRCTLPLPPYISMGKEGQGRASGLAPVAPHLTCSIAPPMLHAMSAPRRPTSGK
jgi:hypothetical protein